MEVTGGGGLGLDPLVREDQSHGNRRLQREQNSKRDDAHLTNDSGDWAVNVICSSPSSFRCPFLSLEWGAAASNPCPPARPLPLASRLPPLGDDRFVDDAFRRFPPDDDTCKNVSTR